MRRNQKSRAKASSPNGVVKKPEELGGWRAIAHFLSMPNSTVQRWTKQGMPIRRNGRNVVASPEALNQWLQRTTGEAVGTHVVTPEADLLEDLKASVAVQNEDRSRAKAKTKR